MVFCVNKTNTNQKINICVIHFSSDITEQTQHNQGLLVKGIFLIKEELFDPSISSLLEASLCLLVQCSMKTTHTTNTMEDVEMLQLQHISTMTIMRWILPSAQH
jgi:hypothetical protein